METQMGNANDKVSCPYNCLIKLHFQIDFEIPLLIHEYICIH